MGLLRDYLWYWVIGVVLLLSFIIIIIFICINKCIRRQGRQILHLNNRSTFKKEVSQRYEATNFQSVIKSPTPSLPPRTQFLIQESQSYENLSDGPDYVNPDVKVDTPFTLTKHQTSVLKNCNNSTDVHDYEEPDGKVDYDYAQDNYEYTSSTKQLDYVEMESKPEPPSYPQPEDTASVDYEEPEDAAFVDYEEPQEDAASVDYEEPQEDTASVDYEEPQEDAASEDYEEPQEDAASVDYEEPQDVASVSTEDYDDVGVEDQEEDYDDLG